MEQKHVKHMNSAEQAAELERLKRLAPEPLPPMPTDVMARDMTPEQRAKFIREASRRAR
jgi:hypothetical protein